MAILNIGNFQFQVIPNPQDPKQPQVVVQPGAHALFSGGIIMDVAVGIDAVTAQAPTQQTPVVPPMVTRALVDTGCTITSIDSSVATKLGLVPRGVSQTYTAKGLATCTMHAVSLGFPGTNLRGFPVLQVQTVDLTGQPFQMLIGRDVMTNWAISYNGAAGFITICD